MVQCGGHAVSVLAANLTIQVWILLKSTVFYSVNCLTRSQNLSYFLNTYMQHFIWIFFWCITLCLYKNDFLKIKTFICVFTNTNFTTNRYVKNIHPVYGARIRTHDLWNMSLLPGPLDQGSRPNYLSFYNVFIIGTEPSC